MERLAVQQGHGLLNPALLFQQISLSVTALKGCRCWNLPSLALHGVIPPDIREHLFHADNCRACASALPITIFRMPH